MKFHLKQTSTEKKRWYIQFVLLIVQLKSLSVAKMISVELLKLYMSCSISAFSACEYTSRIKSFVLSKEPFELYTTHHFFG